MKTFGGHPIPEPLTEAQKFELREKLARSEELLAEPKHGQTWSEWLGEQNRSETARPHGSFVALAAAELMDHFNSRWGQEAPLTLGEAELVADRLWHKVGRLL